MKSIFLFFIIFIVGYTVNAQTVDQLIKNKIDAGLENKTITADSVVLFSQIVLPDYYANNSYQPAWGNKHNVNELLNIIRSSFFEGLNPADYHYEQILRLIEKTNKDKDSVKLADLDLLMTDALLLYSTHLIIGKVDQSKIREGWEIPPNALPEDGANLLERALNSNNLKKATDTLKPDNFMYVYLRKGLAHYRELAQQGGWPTVSASKVLKPGMKDTAVLTLRKHLIITGDLSRDFVSINDTIYDTIVVNAVKQFQFRHNLSQDGVLGKGTLAELNVPVEERIDQIRVNMDRARWVMHHLDNDFLVVNIAGFNIRRVTNDSVTYYSRVIVGKKYHESPIFKGTLKYIVLNPTWTLTYSIATKETLPKLQKDPAYLKKHNMVIMDRSGKEIDPYSIDYSKLSRRNFPYTIRQNAGPHNSLGQVKFIFPNHYSVYLHDTPARSLFGQEKRAYSHGCIRLDKKWELFLSLMDDGSWNMERINKVLDSGKTTQINLTNPIEILLLYWTAGADKQNRLYFDKDVYNRDPAVLRLLDKPLD
jgi:murein L,D-transpeptidase YcbB/YkuD